MPLVRILRIRLFHSSGSEDYILSQYTPEQDVAEILSRILPAAFTYKLFDDSIPEERNRFVPLLGEQAYCVNKQCNETLIGQKSNGIFVTTDGARVSYTREAKLAATVGSYLIHCGEGDHLYYKNNAGFTRLFESLRSAYVSDFALCDAATALQCLRTATGMEWTVQHRPPKTNKNGTVHTPVKLFWTVELNGDAVPTKLALIYRYRVPKGSRLKVGWSLGAVPIGIEDFIIF